MVPMKGLDGHAQDPQHLAQRPQPALRALRAFLPEKMCNECFCSLSAAVRRAKALSSMVPTEGLDGPAQDPLHLAQGPPPALSAAVCIMCVLLANAL
eukprot:6214770-Pleurochrysis_carterae.AAC.3